MKFIKTYESRGSLIEELTKFQFDYYTVSHTISNISEDYFNRIKKYFKTPSLEQGVEISLQSHTIGTMVGTVGGSGIQSNKAFDYLQGSYGIIGFRLYLYDDEYWICYTRSLSGDPRKYRDEHLYLIDGDDGLSELISVLESIQ